MKIEECRSRLLELLKEHALVIGKVTLSSGRESDYYLDERMVTLSAEGASLTAKVILDILKDVELEGFEGRMPPKLSGGQQQRVAIARAMVSQPAIILADEPTANLDSETGANLLDMMRELNERTGMTFVFSTHDTMIMERARRLVRLRDGQVESDETRG